MIAAIATVWMLLKPAGDAVNDRLGSDSSSIDDASSASSDNQDTPSPNADDPAADDETTTSSSTTTTTTEAPFVNGVRSTGFDPLGDNDEHNDAAPLAFDEDPTTSWNTESYTTRSFGAIKEGVGLIVEFEEPTPVDRIVVLTNRTGWSARVYDADEAGSGLAQWNDPIAEFTNLGMQAELDVPNYSATAMLLWITDLGVDPEQTPEDYDAQVAAAERVQRLDIFDIDLVG